MNQNKHERELPKNRFQQVIEIVRERYFDVITLSIFIFCFSIPILVWIVYVNFAEKAINNLAIFVFIYGPFIPGIMILGLGMAGAFYFAHRLIHVHGASPGNDLISGIRKYYRQFLIIYFFIGILYFLCELNQFWILTNPLFSSEIDGVLLALNWFIFFVFMIIFGYMQTHIIIYQSAIKSLIMNSIRFSFGKLGLNLVIILICFLPFIIYEFVPISIIQWSSLGVAGLFYFSFSPIVFTAYSYDLYDKFINQKQFRNIYRRGLKNENTNFFDKP
ncbi:hypothetical protein [Trichlorobacter sp.]|jgi:hypothetical protein|uniref:hypothetical protein n=1 Tax=Trichlorobacter sp. TaxID=2911007 RepID=UPI002A36C3AA|nr:hypothetical protein [Trichlorobacter sp.]MDY0385456.1 hypothetical protein [Trichlorobacter sp.]